MEYSAKAQYNLSDLSPASWESLVSRLNASRLNASGDGGKLFDEYFSTKYRGYTGPSSQPCNGTCARNELCFISFVDPLYRAQCNDGKASSTDAEKVDGGRAGQPPNEHSAIFCHPSGAAATRGLEICQAPGPQATGPNPVVGEQNTGAAQSSGGSRSFHSHRVDGVEELGSASAPDILI